MQYLFFDIECCDGEHICSLGYVIINSNFNIIDKQDIIINPEHEFKLGRAGFDPKVHLAYSEEYFQLQKPFPFFYNNIKELLNRKDTVILGHSIAADLKYLRRACRRYELAKIKIIAYDTQEIFSKFRGDKRNYSLKNIVAELNINISNLHEHKSSDDAEMSMLVIKEICLKLNKNIDELLKKFNQCKRYSGVNTKKKKQIYNYNKSVMVNFKKALAEKGISYDEYLKSLNNE